MKRKKVCIIGSGKMASSYAQIIKNNKKLSLTCVASKNLNRATNFAKKYKIKVCKNISLIEQEFKPDIIIVAITPIALLSVIKKIIKFKNCKIFLEKPIGINLKENKKIIHILRNFKKRNKFYILLNRRYYESTLKAQEILKKNTNEKRCIVVKNFHNMKDAIQNRYTKKNIKYWPYMNAIHLLDYFFIFGRLKIKKIEKIFEKTIEKTKKILIYKIIFSSGDIGIYQSHINIKGNWSVSVHLKDLLLELKPLETLTIKNKKQTQFFDKGKMDKKFKPGLYRMLNSLIFQNQKNYFKANIDHSLKVSEIINKVYKI